MNSLFARMLLAMTVIHVTATFGVGLVYGADIERRESTHESLLSDSLVLHGAEAIRAVNFGDLAGAEALLGRLEKQAGVRAALLGDGAVIAGALVPREVLELADAARRSDKVMRATVGRERWLLIPPDEGGATVLAGSMRRHHGGPLGIPPHILEIFIASILSAGIAFGLARWVSSPITKLRAAARRLADGDLSVRVASGLSRGSLAEASALAADFDHMASRIAGLLESRDQLLRDVSHELRSPLARLSVALELARRPSPTAPSEQLDRIEREVGRLDELVGLMLTMVRLEHPEGISRDASVQLDELCEAVCADAHYEAQGKNREVVITGLTHTIVRGNQEVLRQAIENVVRNAVRFTPEGNRVEVSLTHEQELGASFARIETRDHGPGVPEQALADIFHPFTRVESARERASGGAGLGLAITARAVRVHGGSVRAENCPEGGLKVSILLPLAAPVRSDLGPGKVSS